MSYQSNQRLIRTVLLITALSFWSSYVFAQNGVRYRYKNDQGVPVIANTIPSQYVQNGYEVLDSSSNIIKIVPPAPSEEEAERAKAEKQALSTYQILKRRYSSIDDIERAKHRKLQNIDTNISILKGNISNLKNSIKDLIEQAAGFERSGRDVPKNILKRLSDTKSELNTSEKLLNYRQQEYQDTTAKYDEDIQSFIHGETLEKKRDL